MSRQAKGSSGRRAKAFPAAAQQKIVLSDESVQSVLEQFPVHERICVLDILAAYDAEDKKLADRLRRSKEAVGIAQAFQDCPCACYEGAKKHLSSKEQSRLVALLAQYLLHVTSADQLLPLQALPQELKRLSWDSIPLVKQARILRLPQRGGALT